MAERVNWKKVARDMEFALWYEANPWKQVQKARAIFKQAKLTEELAKVSADIQGGDDA